MRLSHSLNNYGYATIAHGLSEKQALDLVSMGKACAAGVLEGIPTNTFKDEIRKKIDPLLIW